MSDWPDAAKQGSLLAAALNVVLLGVLLLTRRWWSLDGRAGRQPSAGRAAGDLIRPAKTRPSALSPALFLSLLAVIVVVAAGLRLPLAGSSLWWDEVWQARHATVGEWRPDKRNPGQLKFRETTFAQALWNYRKPANHPPMAVASKACHEVWKKTTGAQPGAFNEFVLRLPGFIASLAGLALLALLLRAWGLPGAGLMAAFFLALHPWHIRYGIDNRGYTFLVPLTIIGLWSLWRACGPRPAASLAARGEDVPEKTDSEPLEGGSSPTSTDGHERSAAFQAASETATNAAPTATRGQDGHSTAGAWWLFGLTQALILWAHLLSVWVCLALGATGVWWIWRQHTGPDRWRRLARLAAVQIAGAMLFFQLFLPNLLQAARWGEKNQDGRLVDGPVLFDTLTQVVVGGDSSLGLAGGFMLLLAAIGLTAAHRLRVSGAAGLTALAAGAALFLAAVWVAKFYFYPRFVFALVVPLVIGWAVLVRAVLDGSWQPPAWRKGSKGGLVVAGLRVEGMALLLVLGFVLVLGFLPMWKVGFVFSPLREAAAVLRGAQAAGRPVFGYGFGAEALQYYLPTLPYAREADAPEALADALEKARAAGHPLLVVTGYEDLNRLALPRGFTLLDDASKASVVWSQQGLEPQFAYRIRRIK